MQQEPTPTDPKPRDGVVMAVSASLSPEERAARREAREARREAREAHERENPPEVRRLAKRFEAGGIEAGTSIAIARHAAGPVAAGPAPDVTGALTVTGVHTLLNVSRHFPRARALLQPLRRQVIAAMPQVRDWASLHEQLAGTPRRIGPGFEAMVSRMRQHPDAVAAGVDDTTVDAWRQSARLLMIAKLIADQSGPDAREMMAALQGVATDGPNMRHIASAQVEATRDPRGTLFVSVHNPHLGALSNAAQASFPDLHIVRAEDMKDSRDANRQLLPMIRALRRGGAGIVVPDGAFGIVDREVDIFGEPLPVSSAFARIAWMSGCRVLFTVGSSHGRSRGLSLEGTDLPRRTDGMEDADAYVDAAVAAFAAATRNAMARFPFDTGLSHRLGKRAAGAAVGEAAAAPAGVR